MGQSFDSDRPGRGPGQGGQLPPVAPPPKKLPQRGLPPVVPPPRQQALPAVTPPPPRSIATPPPPRPPHARPIPAPPLSRDPLAESITNVASPIAADTLRDRSSMGDEPTPLHGDENLHWDDEEESTHVFRSNAPPPVYGRDPRQHNHVGTARGIGPDPREARAFAEELASRDMMPQHAPLARPAMSDAVLAGPPSTDTLRLDSQRQGAYTASAPPPQQQQRTSSRPPGAYGHESSIPPAPPIPGRELTPPPVPAAVALGGRTPTLQPRGDSSRAEAPTGSQPPPGRVDPADNIVRDQAFVRLPSGHPNNQTEFGTRRATFTGAERGQPILQPRARTSDPRRWMLGAAAAGALLSVAGLIAFFVTRRPGGVQVEVKDASGSSVARAEVFVDGKKVCDATPCVVRDLEVGRRSIRIIAPGAPELAPITVDVEAGAIKPVEVTLPPSTATLVASGDQSGVRLFVDGVERGPIPARLTDLAPGSHTIKLAGERYAALEKTVELKAGETFDFGATPLAVTRGLVVVSLKTEGVAILLVHSEPGADPAKLKADEAKGRPLDPPFPRKVEVDTSSGTWSLVAKKKGSPDFVAKLDFSDGIAEKAIVVDFEKGTEIALTALPPANPPAAPTSTTPTSTATTPPTSTAPQPSSKPTSTPTATATQTTPAVDANAMGTLNINSIPASRVLLDGQPLGETPRSGVQVTPGTHTVTFIHPELGKKSISVKVGPGETKAATAKLRD
ncbi:MAG: PEGA domain-containing protein [Polyangiaceae bacterium]